MGRIQFWLSWNNGAERIQLPVNPQTIAVNSSFGFEDIEVSGLGEISIFKERGLKEIQLSSFLPKYYNPGYCEYSDIPNPKEVLYKIEKWRDSKKPIRLTITGTDINIACTIREFSYEQERSGNPEDIYFDMTLREYRFFSIKKAELNAYGKPITDEMRNQKRYLEERLAYAIRTGNTGLAIWCRQELINLGMGYNEPRTPAEPQRPVERIQQKTYTVKKGDSLWKIAKRSDIYGDGSKWRKIFDANRDKIKKDQIIYTGQVLVIPK